ncbi:MAG: hypothetical protein AB9Q19_00470 [Candidatus Reddybacter sp.]
MAMPPLQLSGGPASASTGFETGISSPINFGDYHGGASTGGASPPVLATAINSNSLMSGLVAVAFAVAFAVAAKKRGK